MHPISLRSPAKATLFLAVICVGFLLFATWHFTSRAIWKSNRMQDLAYGASEECVRQVAMHKDSLLFAGLGLDPGAASHVRKDGNYESSGWVEQMNDYGHRIHKDWRCVLHYNGADNWQVVYLKIGTHTQGVYVQE